jgi:membrane fusion protein, macrolide-specific efflux system
MNKRNLVIVAVIILVIGGLWLAFGRGKKKEAAFKEVTPTVGHIESSITASGTVQPQNRLEVKPPIGGRIDKILVEEGQQVKVGDILALMSSTDRATLLDAARLQGEDSLKNWQEVYKPTPLLAPINGEVIVKSVDPGQIVSASDPVVVLSDRLIVQAQVDETDIGKVKIAQEAVVTLDAYPDIEAKARVDHIYYESTTVNNVTIYKVDILPDQVPDVFRSGMSANVKIIRESRDRALLVPMDAVKQKDGKSVVFVREESGEKPVKREVKTGLSDENNIEITSGLTAEDTIVQEVASFNSSKSQKTTGTNPFMPSPPGSKRSR